jgi:hypothetical protein
MQQQAGGFQNTANMQGYLRGNNNSILEMQNMFAMNDLRSNLMTTAANKFFQASLDTKMNSMEEQFFRRSMGTMLNNSMMTGAFGGSMINFGQGMNAIASSGMSIGGANIYGPGRVTSALTAPLFSQLQNHFVDQYGMLKGNAGGLDRTQLGDVAGFLANNGAFRGMNVGNLVEYQKGDYAGFLSGQRKGFTGDQQSKLVSAIEAAKADTDSKEFFSPQAAKKFMQSVLAKSVKELGSEFNKITPSDIENLVGLSMNEVTSMETNEAATTKIKKTMEATAKTVGMMADIYKGANKTMTELMEITQTVTGERLVSEGAATRARNNLQNLMAVGQGLGYGGQQVMDIAQSVQRVGAAAGLSPQAAAGIGLSITPNILSASRAATESANAFYDSNFQGRLISNEELIRNDFMFLTKFTRPHEEGSRFVAGRQALNMFNPNTLSPKMAQKYRTLQTAMANRDIGAIESGIRDLTGYTPEAIIYNNGGVNKMMSNMSAEDNRLIMNDIREHVTPVDRVGLFTKDVGSMEKIPQFIVNSLMSNGTFADMEGSEGAARGFAYLHSTIRGQALKDMEDALASGDAGKVKSILLKAGEDEGKAEIATANLMASRVTMGDSFNMFRMLVNDNSAQLGTHMYSLQGRREVLRARKSVQNLFAGNEGRQSVMRDFVAGFMGESMPMTDQQKLLYLLGTKTGGAMEMDLDKVMALPAEERAARLGAFYKTAGIETHGKDLSKLTMEQIQDDILGSDSVVAFSGTNKFGTASQSSIDAIKSSELNLKAINEVGRMLGMNIEVYDPLTGNLSKEEIGNLSTKRRTAIIDEAKKLFNDKSGDEAAQKVRDSKLKLLFSEGGTLSSAAYSAISQDLHSQLIKAREEQAKEHLSKEERKKWEDVEKTVEDRQKEIKRLYGLANPDEQKLIELQLSDEGVISAVMKFMKRVVDHAEQNGYNPEDVFKKGTSIN